MTSKQLTALVIIFLYMVLTVVVGLVSSKMKQKKAEFSEKHPKIAKAVTFTTGAGIGALGAMAVNAIVKGITNSDEDIIDVSYKDITDNNDN